MEANGGQGSDTVKVNFEKFGSCHKIGGQPGCGI
jgi:hypothetical protein